MIRSIFGFHNCLRLPLVDNSLGYGGSPVVHLRPHCCSSNEIVQLVSGSPAESHDRLLSKRISNVTKLLDCSYNIYPKLLVSYFWNIHYCWGASGDVPGWSFAQNGHPQYTKNVTKSLNMKGNVSQRTEYVIINHFLTPWSNLDHFEYPKLEFLRN